jgi:CheY-like chemotaxis protein
LDIRSMSGNTASLTSEREGAKGRRGEVCFRRGPHFVAAGVVYVCGVENVPLRKTFLVLEDDANDAILIRRAFTNAECRVFVCRNTSEARAYLLGAGMYGNRERFPFPEIFVTDLRLVGESGVQFFTWLRGREEFKALPVVVFSGTATPDDIEAVKRLGAARILQKPADPAAMERLLLKFSEEICRPAEKREGESVAYSEAGELSVR